MRLSLPETVLMFVTLTLFTFIPLTSAAEESATQTVAGAGPSTEIVKLFFKEFSHTAEAKQYEFVIPLKSSKHAGGIENTNEYIFGRTGRPLNSKEKALNKGEIILARIPIAFAVGSKAGVTFLNMTQLESIFTKKVTNWKEAGGNDAEIELIGREPTEAIFSLLKANYPFFNEAKFDKILQKDHQVIFHLQGERGNKAIGFGAKPNFKDLNVINVKGFSAGVDVGLVYDLSNQDHPMVLAVKKYSESPEWAAIVTSGTESPPPLQ